MIPKKKDLPAGFISPKITYYPEMDFAQDAFVHTLQVFFYKKINKEVR